MLRAAPHHDADDRLDEADIARNADIHGEPKIPEPAVCRQGGTRLTHESSQRRGVQSSGKSSSGDLEQRVELRQLEQRPEVVVEIREPQVAIQLANALGQ